MVKKIKQASGTTSQFSSILAYVDGGEGSAYVIEAAAKLGEIYSCHVEVLHIVKDVDTSLFVMDVGGSLAASTEIFQIMKDEASQREAVAKAAFADFCTSRNIKSVDPDSNETLSSHKFTLAWKIMSGNDGRELAHRGRLFDLILMAKAQDQVGGVDSIQMEAALFDTGRPILVATDNPFQSDGAPIVIAWDGSREAAHSVALAMPFLAMADKVYLMSVGQRVPGMENQDLGRYLARHDVEVESIQFPKSKKTVGRTLIDACREKKAGLLVMGAYGHSAIGESLFGGVTRDLLESGKLSLFLAH